MDGRWIISGGLSATVHDPDGELADVPTGTFVPVVPCDDAAIERAIKALDGEGYDEGGARSLIEAVLRAAGEKP